ncbi:MAG: hypothetical protein QG672_1642 [Pseudomonadota bacterium]|jgi:hypothetical protein|nr:hypothetical protein [Pseudomonadota bacterium]
MDRELSTWYNERLDRVRRDSWQWAVGGTLGAMLAVLLLILIVIGLMDPMIRPVILILGGIALTIVAVRFAIIEVARYRLKLEFAKKAMLR